MSNECETLRYARVLYESGEFPPNYKLPSTIGYVTHGMYAVCIWPSNVVTLKPLVSFPKENEDGLVRVV